MSKFATCLSCIDGRIHIPVLQYLTNNYDFDYIDLITEPGIVNVLSENNEAFDQVMKKADISIQKHYSKNVFVVAHDDCAGNPVTEEIQKQQIVKVVNELAALLPKATITGLWVNECWQVDEVIFSTPKE